MWKRFELEVIVLPLKPLLRDAYKEELKHFPTIIILSVYSQRVVFLFFLVYRGGR